MENFIRKLYSKSKNHFRDIIELHMKENVEQIDIVSAVTFVADYCLYGVGSLILNGYYRHFKFGCGKLWLIWDCIAVALILFHIRLDIEQGYSILEYWKGNGTDSFTEFCVVALFCLKYVEFFSKARLYNGIYIPFCLNYVEFFRKARLYNGIYRRKYCSVCLQPKQQIANANSLIYKYCICVCRKCERFSSNCDACKFTISTHFR